jgi:lipopolysaccharide export LptBFGC system permease protein LptF
MTRPGTRLRALAVHLFDASTIERLIDPAIADLQHEHESAVRSGHHWRARAIRIAGSLAFWKVVAVRIASASARQPAWATADGGAIGRTVRFAGIATTLFTALFVWVPLRQALAMLRLGNDSLVRLTVYLVPQALAVAVPMGTVFGMLAGGVRTRGGRRVSVLLMFGASLTMLIFAGWLMPEANQAFRETMFALINGFDGRLTRGVNELTLADLRSKDPYQFHFRLALAAAPIVLGIFSLGLATALRRTLAWVAGLMAVTIGFSYYVLLYNARDLSLGTAWFAHGYRLPAALAAWLPNLVFAAAALLLHLRTRAPSAADPSRPDDVRRSAGRPAVPPP